MSDTLTSNLTSNLTSTSTLTLTQPDDWHVHLRDGAALTTVAPHTAQVFGRAICMPNLIPPVTTTAQALAYRDRILQATQEQPDFMPLMTLYLTNNTSPNEIITAQQAGIVACKLYPAGATTNSDAGVTDLNHINPVLEAMQTCGMRLLVHGEVTDPTVDVFDREAVFIDRHLIPLQKRFPELRMVLEHITTAEAVAYVQGSQHLAASLTAHHLLYNRNALFHQGMRPHAYCLPILKRETHRQRLVEAAISGDPRFFLGTDSAPHSQHRKECAAGCAGCYTAPLAMALYATVFDTHQALDKLEGFASHYGADFYGLPRNPRTITLQKQPWQVPDRYDFVDGSSLIPLCAGETLAWQVV